MKYNEAKLKHIKSSFSPNIQVCFYFHVLPSIFILYYSPYLQIYLFFPLSSLALYVFATLLYNKTFFSFFIRGGEKKILTQRCINFLEK
jgi:hypothetical protein